MRMLLSFRFRSALLFLLMIAPLVQACSRSQAAPAPPPPPAVSVVEVTPETIPLSSEWITTLDGFVNAQIRPQVSGYLIKRTYREGSMVQKGEVLFEIDPRPFAATLAQTQAQLAQAQAEMGRTERDVQRDTPLAAARAIPQSQLDNDVQANLAAQAAVKAAQAAVSTAELNVGFTKVRSLVDGIAAIATAQIGDLVNPSTLLTTVSQVDPIRAYFSLSEQEYLRIADQINRSVPKDGLWKTGTALTLTLADGTIYPSAGAFLAADRQIDPRTGTIRISAAFPNPRHLLRPGQYGRVRAATAVVHDALLVPQRAVNDVQGQSQVRVVGADGKVSLKTLTLGGRSGNRWIVEHGLDPGAQVIVDATTVPEGTIVRAKRVTLDATNGIKGS
ncbi:MAG TPA: efflux RND transporter periplasmic adaptor subunit [Vicinamibacterales bacterium]